MKSVVGVKRRAVATFAATAMVTGGSMAVLGAAPASAATVSSSNLTYSCVTSLGVKDFGVKASMGVPVSVAPGRTVTPKNTKMDLVIPEDLVGAIKFFFNATAVSGGSDNAIPSLAKCTSCRSTRPVHRLQMICGSSSEKTYRKPAFASHTTSIFPIVDC